MCYITSLVPPCRRQIELLEEEHCLAEAQRLSQLAEQEGNRVELEEREQELTKLKTDAERKKKEAEDVRTQSLIVWRGIEKCLGHYLFFFSGGNL